MPRTPTPTPTPTAPANANAIAIAITDAQRPVTGEHGPTSTTTPVPPWPVYPTHAPPSTTLRYALVQTGPGATTGEAELAWLATPAEGSYTLHVIQRRADHSTHEWESAGAFDDAGVAPTRLAERNKGKDKRAINFDRANRRVRFSGSTQALALAPGAQDRWSWIVQLAGIAQAAHDADPPADTPGTTWDIQVAGLRGELDRWRFRVLGDAQWPGNDAPRPSIQAPALLHVLREPDRPFDLRIEAWLSPSLHHLPIGLRMSNPPGAWSLELWPPADGP